MVEIPTDEPDNPFRIPRTLLLSDYFDQKLNQVFDYANRPESVANEASLETALGLPTPADGDAMLEVYRRLREYIATGKNNVWHWYIANLIQPLRLANMPASRLVGNPPWVVYNAMAADRQDAFRRHAGDRNLWAGRHLATQNDLAATFVATCVDYYLQPGGKFGFVLPYAALRARHWEHFRTGEWSLPPDAGRNRTLADLSKDAWDMFAVSDPPFPQANSSVVFGARPRAIRQNTKPKALASVLAVSNDDPVDTKMSWAEVKPRLRWNRRREWPTAPSPAYAGAFRNGATLFPQSLLVFERPQSEARGVVYFRTNPAKGVWKGKERDGQVEARFVKPALFSRQLLPFGTIGHSYVVAPFSVDGDHLLPLLPKGNDAARFRLYWDDADRDWREYSSGRPPLTLLDQVDHQGKLSSQICLTACRKVVYQRSGTWLQACVVDARTIADGTLNWFASDHEKELHYLSAIFNAVSLGVFFKEECRFSDRHFQMGPVQNLPIPAYNRRNAHHRNLAEQSQRAHERVAALVAGSQRVTRNDVLRDAAMQPILVSIDESARAILPDFCEQPPG